MIINSFRLLIFVCFALFSVNVFSEKSTKPFIGEYKNTCHEAESKVLEKVPELKANLLNINDSLVGIELALLEHKQCTNESQAIDSKTTNCDEVKKSYHEKIENHEQLVLNNEHQLKEFFLLSKEHSYMHCDIN